MEFTGSIPIGAKKPGKYDVTTEAFDKNGNFVIFGPHNTGGYCTIMGLSLYIF